MSSEFVVVRVVEVGHVVLAILEPTSIFHYGKWFVIF
jgi:hypothetical protein